ncbi:EpsG family protein [Candidatus Ventrimonas sp. KK005]
MSTQQTYLFYISILAVGTILIQKAFQIKRGIILRWLTTYHYKTNLSVGIFLMFSFLVVFIPLASRNCGTDTAGYYWSYAHNRQVGNDLLFYYLSLLLHAIIPSPKIGLGIISGISLLIVYYAFIELKKDVNVSLCFIAYFFSLYFYLYNYVRMMLAVSFVIFGYSMLIKGKRTKAVISFTIAAGIHFASIIVLMVYMGIMIIPKHRRILVTLIGGTTLLFLMNPRFFLSLITYERYREQINLEALKDVRIGMGTTIKILPIFVIQMIYLKRFKKEFQYNIMFVSTFVNYAFSILGYFVGVASRLSNMYFVLHLLFLIPWIDQHISSKAEKRWIRGIFCFYLVFLYFLMSFNFKRMGIVPYH